MNTNFEQEEINKSIITSVCLVNALFEDYLEEMSMPKSAKKSKDVIRKRILDRAEENLQALKKKITNGSITNGKVEQLKVTAL